MCRYIGLVRQSQLMNCIVLRKSAFNSARVTGGSFAFRGSGDSSGTIG